MPVTTRAMARRSNMVMLNVTPAAARCVVAGGGADNIIHKQNNIVTEYSREEYDKLSEDDPQLFPPVSDEEDEEVVEQHNVGECECKDCKRIEAEDDSDEEDVECVGCGSPISGPWVCVKGHDWCPDCRPDLLEKPKCRDASTEENEKKANMKKWVEEQMNVEHSGISPEDLAGKILDLVESNESVPFFQECFDEYLAERGRIWEEKETFCTDDESEEEEVQGVVPCLIGGKQFLIDPINKDMFDYDEFMRTGEADWVAVAHKNANIQYL